MAKSLHVKKGDRVKVISGKDRGVIGEIIAVYPKDQRVTVQGVNIVKRHLKDQQSGSRNQVKGGIIASEAPIHASNVQLVVYAEDADGKTIEVATRIGYELREVTVKGSDGEERTVTKKVRIARKTGKEIK
jgi:large subunit ribosomal protein L24